MITKNLVRKGFYADSVAYSKPFTVSERGMTSSSTGQNIFIWMRGTFPRYRYDQLMNIGWKIMFMKNSDPQKCHLPKVSLIIRPVALGNQ